MTALALGTAWLVLGLATHYAVCRMPAERSRFDDDPLCLLAACLVAWYMIWAFAGLWVLGRLGTWYIARVQPRTPDAAQLDAERELDAFLTPGLSRPHTKD